MKPAHKTAAGIFGLVLLGALISASVFVYFGSELGVYSAIALTPMLVLGGGLWVRKSIATTGTDQTQYVQRRAREVGESFTSVWETHERIRQEYPEIAGDGLGVGLDALIADLNEAGIEFDRNSGSFVLGDVGNLEQVNTLEGRIDDLEDALADAFGEKVSHRIMDITSNLDRLDGLVATTSLPSESDVNTEDWEGAGATLERARERAVTVIDEGGETIQSTVGSAGGVDRADIEDRVADARDAAARNAFSEAVTALLDARDIVRREGETTFSDARRELQSLLETVATSEVHDYTTEVDVADTRRAVDELDDAMELSALTEHRQSAKETCRDAIATLESKLDDAVHTLETADIPEGYYSVPPAAEDDYVADLADAAELSGFEATWQEATDNLTSALDTLEPKAKVVSGYDTIREHIEEELQASGQVIAADLPVRQYEEQFMGLYYRENTDAVSFDMDEPSLELDGDTESYEVAVTVRFAEGGPDREVTVTIDGSRFDESETIVTPLVGTATFTEVPYGEYTVSVEPDTDAFRGSEDTVQVDSDTDLEMDLSAVTLRDRICEGLEDEASEYIDDVATTLEEKFDEEGYLSSTMSYRMDEDYVPCLLVLWADRTEYDATQLSDDTVLVYDEDTLISELENVITYNLDAEDSMSFDDLRERFLTAPVPDTVLSQMATDVIGDEVTADEDTLTKH